MSGNDWWVKGKRESERSAKIAAKKIREYWAAQGVTVEVEIVPEMVRHKGIIYVLKSTGIPVRK